MKILIILSTVLLVLNSAQAASIQEGVYQKSSAALETNCAFQILQVSKGHLVVNTVDAGLDHYCANKTSVPFYQDKKTKKYFPKGPDSFPVLEMVKPNRFFYVERVYSSPIHFEDVVSTLDYVYEKPILATLFKSTISWGWYFLMLDEVCNISGEETIPCVKITEKHIDKLDICTQTYNEASKQALKLCTDNYGEEGCEKESFRRWYSIQEVQVPPSEFGGYFTGCNSEVTVRYKLDHLFYHSSGQ